MSKFVELFRDCAGDRVTLLVRSYQWPEQAILLCEGDEGEPRALALNREMARTLATALLAYADSEEE